MAHECWSQEAQDPSGRNSFFRPLSAAPVKSWPSTWQRHRSTTSAFWLSHDSVNGLLTSIALETVILARQMPLRLALKTALGMSLISMIGMEAAMNITDVMLTGGAMLTWWVIPIMLAAGFVAPLPYNYWRLKALGKACH